MANYCSRDRSYEQTVLEIEGYENEFRVYMIVTMPLTTMLYVFVYMTQSHLRDLFAAKAFILFWLLDDDIARTLCISCLKELEPFTGPSKCLKLAMAHRKMLEPLMARPKSYKP